MHGLRASTAGGEASFHGEANVQQEHGTQPSEVTISTMEVYVANIMEGSPQDASMAKESESSEELPLEAAGSQSPSLGVGGSIQEGCGKDNGAQAGQESQPIPHNACCSLEEGRGSPSVQNGKGQAGSALTGSQQFLCFLTEGLFGYSR